MDKIKHNKAVAKKTYLTTDRKEVCKWLSEGRKVFKKDINEVLDINTYWTEVKLGDALTNGSEYTVDHTPEFEKLSFMELSVFEDAWKEYDIPTIEIPDHDCWGAYDPSYRTDKKQMAKDWANWGRKWIK